LKNKLRFYQINAIWEHFLTTRREVLKVETKGLWRAIWNHAKT
jgi:hypothetical protein